MPQSAHITCLIAEYQALKTEQTYRITVRDTCLILALTFLTAGFTAYFQGTAPQKDYLAITLPFAATAAFWIYITNDIFVTHIRKYISEHVQAEIKRQAAVENPGIVEHSAHPYFHWEEWHRKNTTHRMLRKAARVAVVGLVFTGSSLLALLLTLQVAWSSGNIVMTALWCFALLVVVATAVVNVSSSDP